MKKAKNKTLEPSLRLDNNSILKEIGRLGPCDVSNNCHYGRDWTLLVYKKHLGGKQQPMTVDRDQLIVKAGEYRVGIKHSDFPEQCQRKGIESLFIDFGTLHSSDSISNTLPALLSVCKEWTKKPSFSISLPEYFYPLQFGTAALDADEDEEHHSSLLEQLECDRHGLLLTVEQIGLLANIDRKADNNHVGDCLSPSDLEVERAIVNESMGKCIKDDSATLEQTLVSCWSTLRDWMDMVETLNKEYDTLVGAGLDKTMETFLKQYGIVSPFQDFWAPLVPGFKKKTTKKTEILATVDETFINYMDQLLKVTEDFYMTFISTTMVSKLEQFNTHVITDLKKVYQQLGDRQKAMEATCSDTSAQIAKILEMKDKITSLPEETKQQLLAQFKTQVGELEDHIDAMLEEIHVLHKQVPEFYDVIDLLTPVHGHTKLTIQCIKDIKQYANEKWMEQKSDIEQLKLVYLNESLPNVAGRIEKVAHKDFRKKLKKIEHRYSTMRQSFTYQLKNTLLLATEQDDKDYKDIHGFYHTILRTQMVLMKEGAMMEMFQLRSYAKSFGTNHKNLIDKKSNLANTFRSGIAMGQKTLAVVIKSMVLAEGKRLELENVAIHRAKSIGGNLSGNKVSAITTPLYAAIALMASIPDGSPKKKSKAKPSTPDTASSPSIKNESPRPSSDKALASDTTSSLINKGNSKDSKTEKTIASPVKANQNQSPSNKSVAPTSKPASATKTTLPSSEKSVASTPTSTGKLISATMSTLPSSEKSNPAIAPPLPAIISKLESKSRGEKAQPPGVKKQSQPVKNSGTTTSSVTIKNNKDHLHSQSAEMNSTRAPTVPTHASNANTNQRGNTTEKVQTFSRKRQQTPSNDTQHKGTIQDSAPSEMVQRVEVAESAEQIDPWTSPAPSSSSSSSMTWSQTVASKLPNQTSTRTSTTTATTRTSPSPSSPASDSAWNQSIDLKTNQTDTWNVSPSALSWSKAVSSSNEPSSLPLNTTSSEPAEVAENQSQEASWSQSQPSNSGWGEPVTSHKAPSSSGWGEPVTSHTAPSNSGWGEPVTSHTPQQETTTLNTASELSKKERWSSEWAAKAKSFSDGSQPVEASFDIGRRINDSKEDQHQPTLVSVSLKDILANSQETPLQNKLNKSYENNSQRSGMMPPPALGGINTSTPSLITTDMNQLYQLNQDSLINMVQSLRIENQQLQQSMMSMQQALTMTMTLAKEREEQTLQLFNTRKQSEMEEARMYILSLEEQIKDLRAQVRAQPASPSTNAFVNQDLFANYRQEMHTDGSDQQHYKNNGGQYQKRPGKKPYWQYNKTVVKCSNCGESDHISSECKDSCRYCGSLNHLSENCERA